MDMDDMWDAPKIKRVEHQGAIFSDDKVHRYSLTRRWSRTQGMLLWLMLNPSTADEKADDPTIRRLRGYTQAWAPGPSAFAGFMVGNVFSFRATNPRELRGLTLEQKRGPDWADWLGRQVSACTHVVCAWGDQLDPALGRAMLTTIAPHRPIYALHLTDSGAPAHPLYLPARLRPEVWSWHHYGV